MKQLKLLWVPALMLAACNNQGRTPDQIATAAYAGREMSCCPVPGTGSTADMVLVEGGTFTMGTNESEAYDHERPAHQVEVDGFYMDCSEVTNRQFKAFIDATGYITVAERKPDWEELKQQLPRERNNRLLTCCSLGPWCLKCRRETCRWNISKFGGNGCPAPAGSIEGPSSSLEGRWEHPWFM